MAKSAKVFFDTNVLVYQHNRNEPAKQKLAQRLIEDSIRNQQAVISTQVVQEFMNAALKKFDTQIPAAELELVMVKVLKPLCQHGPDFEFYKRTLDLYQVNSLNFYDALIIQAAIDLGCETLYSEDLQDGQKFGRLTVKNPFA